MNDLKIMVTVFIVISCLVLAFTFPQTFISLQLVFVVVLLFKHRFNFNYLMYRIKQIW
jgi:hypothetical protein